MSGREIHDFSKCTPGRNDATIENAGETDVSEAVGAVLGAANEIDDSLSELIAIWSSVSPEIRQAILAIARQSTSRNDA
ncbi:hypothetical protein [Novipirellula galeiformis]|uniref:hypothetical protein n=1 Tax=Novipirellula galeiformis TaxID=2528004 RepID=UPI0011B6F815|nr:hypothetical protein [Novipirellula galeiformis]